jgi:hypothetical protein
METQFKLSDTTIHVAVARGVAMSWRVASCCARVDIRPGSAPDLLALAILALAAPVSLTLLLFVITISQLTPPQSRSQGHPSHLPF